MTEQYTNILVERRGRVGLVTLNRPEALNALNKATMDELVAAVFDPLADDRPDHRIETGTVPATCEHADPHRRQISRDERAAKR